MHYDTYIQRGVSSSKKDVREVSLHNPDYFCPYITDQDKVFSLHADGAGSKILVAYLLWKQSNDLSLFRSALWDAIVMNTDDLACIGSLGPFAASCIIAKNSFRIPSEIVQDLILFQQSIQESFAQWGIDLLFLGGETADLTDQIKTLSIDVSLSSSFPKSQLILTKNIIPGMKIIGLASFGKTSYESVENSGIGSNGLTSARHDLLSKEFKSFTETFESMIPSHLVYRGNFHIDDPLPSSSLTIGQSLLSPTRTYLPVLKAIFKELPNRISAIVHCTGGGQTKCLRFSKGIHYVKDNLFPFPPLFTQLQTTHSLHQMFSVFNCGHRMELFVQDDPALIDSIIDIAKQFSLPAKVIGYTEAAQSSQNSLSIIYQGQTISYAI